MMARQSGVYRRLKMSSISLHGAVFPRSALLLALLFTRPPPLHALAPVDHLVSHADRIITYIEGLPAGAFGAAARGSAPAAGCQDVSDPPTSLRQCVLAKKIAVARAQIAQGAFGAAENKLRQDVAPKVDGDFAGDPANDWLTDQAARIAIYCEVLYLVEDLAAFQQDWFFDQAGVKNGGGYQPGISEETVNLFNGNLLLTYTDLRLPGKGGLDLAITSSYKDP
ncbi:MAG: hypothetical protein HYV63_27150 [Candidatus Schekmanbacteria bacterium]|nr:hypothetical protein [Candidatus Schekmanbacteria bacterium]